MKVSENEGGECSGFKSGKCPNKSENVQVCPSKSQNVRANPKISKFVRINLRTSEFDGADLDLPGFMGWKGGEALNRLGFIILSILRESEAMGRLSSMTLKEIALAEDFGWKENTISKKIREFEQSGYVGRGLKEGKAATYYITKDGLECLERERKG